MRLITAPLLKISLATVATVAVLTSLPSKVMAIGFTGNYDPTNWNAVSNTNADGSVDTTAAPTSIDLIGGNDNSGLSGTTDWTITITAAGAGNLSFDWSYFLADASGKDAAGYLYNGIFTQLSSTDGEFNTSPVTLTLNTGDTFGFRMSTVDNKGGIGALTVSNFNVQPVPFEFEGSAGILTIGAIWGINKWRKNRAKK